MTSKSPNLKGWNPDSPSAAVIRVEENSVEWTYVALDLLKFTVTLGLTVYLSSKAFGLIGNMLGVINQENSQQLETKKSLAKRLKRPDILNMSFNSYESRLLADVLGGEEISVSFADVGGLEAEVEEVFDSIVFPIQLWNHRQSLTTASKHSVGKSKDQNTDLDRLVACPTGVLLYGAPGTGKTLIAKAIAKESGATFINIKASSVMDKWFGESDRLVSALFSLARKLGPSIVFIDEVETLLRKRDGSHTNPALATLQGVFLAEWDGVIGDRQESAQKELSSSPPPPPPSSSETVVVKKNAPVVVLGATNRPGDIDAAFLRRMPVQIRTQMPNQVQRLSILQAMLREESLDVAVSLQKIAENTEGYSGSDLREVVRIASAQRVKSMKQSFRDHFLRTPTSSTKQSNADAALNVILDQHQTTVQRPLLKEDFDFALDKTRDSVLKTMQFNTETFQKDNEQKASHFLSLLASLSSQTNTK